MSLQGAIQSIQDTTDRIIQVAQGLPEEVIRWKPSEDEWSIMEVLCHVAEATPYWLKEIKQLVEMPGTEWGRELKHEGRLAAVAQADQRSVSDVLQEIKASKEQVKHVLGSLREVDLKKEAPSRNPRFGTKPMQFIVDHLLVEHVDTHLKQIKRNINAFEARNQTI